MITRGDIHGDLSRIKNIDKSNIDLIICSGDFLKKKNKINKFFANNYDVFEQTSLNTTKINKLVKDFCNLQDEDAIKVWRIICAKSLPISLYLLKTQICRTKLENLDKQE